MVRCLRYQFLIITFFILVGYPCSRLLSSISNQLRIVRTLKTRRNRIAFVRDEFGKLFLVKQASKERAGRFVDAISEAIASQIACESGILSQNVFCISSQNDCVGKYYANRMATIHTVVPGREMRFFPAYRSINLKQSSKGKRRRGLTRKHIDSMALHEDLARVVALDTFVGNTDRHPGNLFYDKRSNHFYAIDMELAFRRDLCSLSYENLKNMILTLDRKPFSQKSYEALRLYRDTLSYLVDHYPVAELEAMLNDHIQLVWFDKKVPRTALAKIAHMKRVMRSSVRSTSRLIHLINDLLGDGTAENTLC